VLAWAAAGWAAVWRLGRDAERITDPGWVAAAREAAGRLGVSGAVRLLRGGPAAMPVTWGVWRPTILLPAECDAWPAARRRAVLLHELAHVRRRDALTQWLGLAACAAYWFNPLAWYAAARLRAEREQACDDLVLEAGERPSDYAAQLLNVAYALRRAPTLASAAMAMARPSGLERRLLAILDARRRRRGPARWLAAAGLLGVLCASATLAAARLVAREVPGPAVSGRVVGADGKPVEGAEMVLLFSHPNTPGGRGQSVTAERLGRGRTDARGDFRVDVPGDRVKPGERVLLVATAPGHGFAARALTELAEPLGEPLTLPAERPLGVRLVDLQGSPIAGAKVRLAYAYPSSGGEGLWSEATRDALIPGLVCDWTSDADGRFTVRGLGAGDSLGLEVQADGFGRQQLRVEAKGGEPATTLALGRTHVVEGRVTLGKGGPPAAGAHVRARSWSSNSGYGQFRGDADTTTGADGRYRIEVAPGGSIRVEIDPPREGADGFLLRGDLLVLGDSVTTRRDYALTRGVLVRGRVTEAGSGRPVAGAVVTHQAHERNNPYFIPGNAAWMNGDEQKAVTDADGTFRLGVMPGPGYLQVKGSTDDYLHEEVSAVELNGQLIWPNTRHYPDALKKISPKPEESPLDVELTLRRGTTVRGRVVGVDGRPARDAVLFTRWYVGPNQTTINFGQRVKPAPGGRFELNGCDPAATAPVFFFDAKRQQGATVELSGKQAGHEQEVRLQPCGTATVRFVDAGGKPVRRDHPPGHLEIVLTPGASFADLTPKSVNDEKKSPLMADAIMVGNLDRQRYNPLKPDDQGRVTFPTLIPGATYRVIVFNQPSKTQIEFTVKPGEAKDLGDLVIRNPDHAG
jgi:hypothetical protein